MSVIQWKNRVIGAGGRLKVIVRGMSMSKVEIYRLFILVSLVLNIFLGYLLGKHYDSHSAYRIEFMFAIAIWLLFLRGIVYSIDIQILPKEKKDSTNSDSPRDTSSSLSPKGEKKE